MPSLCGKGFNREKYLWASGEGIEKVLVTVNLYGVYRAQQGASKLELDLEPGARVMDVVHKLAIQESVDLWVLVNGIPGKKDQLLKEGDTVDLFQPVGGGKV